MILALDTYYYNIKAKTVCIAFDSWTDSTIEKIYSGITETNEPYQPGEFYKRELPCILSLLKSIAYDKIDAIVIDGYVFLDDESKPGLGAHLYNALDHKIPVIGIAKTNFVTLNKNKEMVLRGKSTRPLYVTAAGVNLADATQSIKSMVGEHRIPTLLKTLDSLTKERP